MYGPLVGGGIGGPEGVVILVEMVLVLGGLMLWVGVSARVWGWERLQVVAAWPGVRTIAAVQAVVQRGLSPMQRRGIVVRTNLAIARIRCWRLGMNMKNPR